MKNQPITVYITNRAPVEISPEDWPIVAEARADSWDQGDDQARYSQARLNGELDTHRLVLRQHEDGRTIIHGTVCFKNGGPVLHGGELHKAGVPPTPSLRRVAQTCHMPRGIVQDLLDRMPPEAL